MPDQREIHFRYLNSSADILRGASLQIELRQAGLIWGGNGSGKSTLAMCLCGVIPHVVKGIFSGDVLWAHASLISRFSPNVFSFVSQRPYVGFLGLTVEDEIGINGGSIDPELRRLLACFMDGIEPTREVGTLSTGQRQRVALATAFANHPNLLILDEPFEALDRDAADLAGC